MLLGALYTYPPLFESQEANSLSEADFADPLNKMAYSIMFNLFSIGHNKFSDGVIESYISGKPSLYKFYNTEIEIDENTKVKQGSYYFENLREHGDKELFEPSVPRVKKFTLLRNLESNGVSVRELYDWDTVDAKVIEAQNIWLDKTEVGEIANIVSDKILMIMNDAAGGVDRDFIQAGEGLEALVESFKEAPDFGSPFFMKEMNTITRGARLGKYYLRSASTGGYKSRGMMSDACMMAFDELYDPNSNSWIKNGDKEAALFISTELDLEELQTMALAFITGIQEEEILDGNVKEEDLEVLQKGIQIMKNSPLYFELIPDFTIQEIETIIRQYYREKDCKFFFFDYQHVSMSLMQEMASLSGSRLREDQILFMMSTAFKNLANNLKIFIESGTQLNGNYMEAEEINQNLLRGGKSQGDRLDVGFIGMRIRPRDEEIVEEFVNLGLEKPNYYLTFYKVRRGKYAGVKLWCDVDGGTCRMRGLFVTDSNNEPIPFKGTNISVIKRRENIDKQTSVHHKESAF